MTVESRHSQSVPDLKQLRVPRIIGEIKHADQLQTELNAANEIIRKQKLELQERGSRIQQLEKDGNADDPDGYYRALGLDPQFAQGLTPEKIDVIVKQHYRIYAMAFHTDTGNGGGNPKRMKKINEAYSALMPKPKTTA
jgi:hypothetical protein